MKYPPGGADDRSLDYVEADIAAGTLATTERRERFPVITCTNFQTAADFQEQRRTFHRNAILRDRFRGERILA